MNSSDERAGADRPACPPAGPVPVGWERKVEEGSVCYISPSGTALTSLEQTRAYLLADGTCKCGLECPLNMHKVFNFDPGAVVAGRGAPGAQGQQDMTKLCNHRRKTVAMATLYRSMEGTPGPGSRRPGTGPGLSPLFPVGGRPAVPPGAVGSFPRAPARAKTPEAAPAGDRLIPPPFPRPRDVFPGANGSPESRPPPSPHFGRRLPPPDAVAAPRAPTEDARSHRPAGRTSARAAPSPPEPGGPGPCPAATNGTPQAGKDDSPVSDALTNQSSNNPPVPLDAAPEGRGFLGLPLGQLLAPPAGTPFPASSLLSAAAKAQLGAPGGPDPAPPPSTLPPRPLAPNALLSVVGERGLGKAARRPRRPDAEDPVARRVLTAGAEPKGTPPPAPGQPLAALLSLLGAQGSPGGHGGPLAPLPAGDSSPCPGTGLLPSCQDFNNQLLGLFGQLATSSEPTSGTPPQPKAPSHNSAPGVTASPAITKGPPALGAGSGGEGATGGALGCPLPPAAEPVAFVGQEQALALGGSLPPGLLLGTLPFSVALGQHPPAPGGDPEGPSLPSLLAASLLPGQPPVPLLPLGVPLPTLDLLPPPGALLSALLPLAPAGEKGPETPAAGPEGYPALPDGPLLFSALPASLALDPTLLAAGLAPSESTPGAPPPGLASPPVAPTSTGAPPATTTEAPCGEGRVPDGPPGTPGRLHPLGPQLGSSLLGATLLGDLPALSPLLQNQPLLPPALPPLGLSLGAGQGPPLLGTASPLACLLQSLQLGPGFGPPEKPATPSGSSAGGPPTPSDRPEGPPSALEPPAPSRAEVGSASPRGGARGGPGSQPSLKRGRRRAEGLNGETPAPRGPPSTKSPRRGAGRGRGGWGARRHFNGQAGDGGEKGAPPAAPPAPHPAWRCNGDIPAAERQLKAEEIKGNSLRLRPSRRGRRRKASAPRPSARLETPRGRGLSAEPGPGPAVDPALARRPRPGRPVKNRRRKLLT
ncbi:methyl-CpG-binding domain protein 6 [Struthio camelus]|uniref:methyl-CpG-binding domain protein 6 n=1 Tax=Struthio camelus TaxID=8801 RepID=UPI00360429F6